MTVLATYTKPAGAVIVRVDLYSLNMSAGLFYQLDEVLNLDLFCMKMSINFSLDSGYHSITVC